MKLDAAASLIALALTTSRDLDTLPARRAVEFEIRATREEADYTLVEGIAYPALDVPESGEVPGEDAFRIDSYRTWMAPETLRQFAHRFLERGTGGIDSHHDHGSVGSLVESWVTREATEAYPTLVWVVVVKVLKESTRAELREGKLKGFSIEFTGKYRARDLIVTGVGKVRTNEILTPYPLTLSLVKAPAIGIPFTDVEARSQDDARVTVLVRCMEDPSNPVTPPPPASSEPAAVDPTPATRDAPPAAPPATDPKPVTVEELRASFAALLGNFRTAQTLGPEAVEAFVRQTRGTTEWSSLQSIWANCSTRWAVRDAMSRAILAAESVYYECSYSSSGDNAEMVKLFRALGVDFNAVVQAICDDADTAMGTSTRSAPTPALPETDASTRAGKKLSKATRSTLETARQCMVDGQGHLDGLLAEESTEESATESETKSARELAELRAEVESSQKLLAARDAEMVALRGEHEGVLARATAAEKRAELAEQRVAALESARPAPRAADEADADADTSTAATRTTEPARPFGGLLNLRQYVGRGGSDDDSTEGDDSSEE